MKKLIKLGLIFTFLLASSCINGLGTKIDQMPSGKYELDEAHSSVHFKVKHLGLSYYTARFTDLKADLDFNAKKPQKSKLTATINVNSIKTEYPFPKRKNFDKFLSQNENWFNAKKFPQIKFEATSIRRTGWKKGSMKGNLTMLGVTKPVKFDVKFNGMYKNKPYVNLPALGFSAKTTIKRSQWGFVALVPNIADEVEIIIETEFHKKQ